MIGGIQDLKPLLFGNSTNQIVGQQSLQQLNFEKQILAKVFPQESR